MNNNYIKVINNDIYSHKNIMSKELITNNFAIKKARIAGNRYNEQKIYYPNTIKFDKDIIPHKFENHTCNFKEKWENICGKYDHLETNSINIGINDLDNPTLQISQNKLNINGYFNFIDPKTNVVMMKNTDGAIETLVPVYNQWDAFHAVHICYDPEIILRVTTSNIFIILEKSHDNTEDNQKRELLLNYDCDLVPNRTKVKIYFIRNNQAYRSRFKISLVRHKKKYIFTSIIKRKKIKLVFMENTVYSIS